MQSRFVHIPKQARHCMQQLHTSSAIRGAAGMPASSRFNGIPNQRAADTLDRHRTHEGHHGTSSYANTTGTGAGGRMRTPRLNKLMQHIEEPVGREFAAERQAHTSANLFGKQQRTSKDADKMGSTVITGYQEMTLEEDVLVEATDSKKYRNLLSPDPDWLQTKGPGGEQRRASQAVSVEDAKSTASANGKLTEDEQLEAFLTEEQNLSDRRKVSSGYDADAEAEARTTGSKSSGDASRWEPAMNVEAIPVFLKDATHKLSSTIKPAMEKIKPAVQHAAQSSMKLGHEIKQASQEATAEAKDELEHAGSMDEMLRRSQHHKKLAKQEMHEAMAGAKSAVNENRPMGVMERASNAVSNMVAHAPGVLKEFIKSYMLATPARRAEHEKMVAKHPEMYGYNPEIHKAEQLEKSASNIIKDIKH